MPWEHGLGNKAWGYGLGFCLGSSGQGVGTTVLGAEVQPLLEACCWSMNQEPAAEQNLLEPHSREMQLLFPPLPHFLFLFCSIKPLNATQAYGPNLRYIVRWRRRDPRGSWYNETVKTPRHVVWNTPIYVPYEIKVQAENDFGRAPEPDTVIGYSGEDCEYFLSRSP